MDAFGSMDDADTLDDLDGIEEIDFDRATAEAMYQDGYYMTDPRRWERVREKVPFDDLIAEMEGTHNSVISCPFHGRDSTPSFNLYRRTNDAYCFGCPDGERYYDSVRYVAAKFNCDRKEALRFLEEKYGLPPLPDIEQVREEWDEPETVELTFSDLAPLYRTYAAQRVRAALERYPEDIRNKAKMAEAYVYVYFANAPGREEKDAPGLPLAQILGDELIAPVLKEKTAR